MTGLTKGYALDTHRAVDPRETLARIRPLLARMGITRIANVTGLDRIGVPVVMVARPNARSVAVAQGKGLSLDAAKASGAMEAAETWHAERIALPVRYASHADLRGDAAILDIDRLPKIRGGRFHHRLKLLWVEGVDLLSGDRLWAPFEMVQTDYTRPVPPGSGCFPASSNGLASGNHIHEATCHAICELIERDATSLWHHLPERERRLTRVRPETVDHAGCVDVLGRLAAAGLDLGIWETTSDIGVPAFRCIIAEADGREGHIGIGDGCHLDHGVALLRALTEAVQTRMTYISGARDDITPDEFTPEAVGRKCAFARGLMTEGEPVRSFSDATHSATQTFESDLALLLRRLGEAGCGQVVAVDLTRPEIGISVVRVVVPGLEAPHDDHDYRPGPRALGLGRQAA